MKYRGKKSRGRKRIKGWGDRPKSISELQQEEHRVRVGAARGKRRG